MHSVKTLLAVGVTVLGLCACSSNDPAPYDPSSSGGGAGGGGEGGASSGPGCTEPTPVACEDDVILGMNLQADIAAGALQTSPDGSGFRSDIDATAGGAFNPDPDSYVYGRFTENGLEKVSISDEDSLTSMDWDIAFRRYVIRINSGPSGPSCVKAAHLKDTVTYDSVTSLPDEELQFHADDYFTADCSMIPDGSGLPNSPATSLSGFWSYPDCVSMTHVVHVIQLADGRTLKFMVDNYYRPEAQAQCDSGTPPAPGTAGAANFQIRWAFLQ